MQRHVRNILATMTLRYTSKEDFQGSIIGLENYIPGDPSTKDLAIKASSGTSGIGPTVIVEKSPVQSKKEKYLKKIKASIRLGGQRASALAGVNLLLRHAHINRTLAIDAKDLKHPAIAHVLAGFAPTELYAIPLSFLRTVMRTLKTSSVGWAFRRVRLIYFSGEWTSLREKEEIFKPFHKLEEYIDEYGSAEAGSYAYSCKELTKRYSKKGLLVFHPTPVMHSQLKDISAEGIGEVIVSTHELLNYRTGDAGKLITETCTCGSTQTLVLFGRIHSDYLNCAGATFALEKVERVFEALTDIVQEYQICVKEHDDGVTLRGEVHIYFVSTKEYESKSNAEDYVEQFVNRMLPVTPTRTLGELVKEGVFLPTITQVVKSIPKKGYKRVRLKKIV